MKLIVLGALSLVLSSTLLGCKKSSETSFGAEADINEINTIQNAILSKSDPRDIQVGDFTYILSTQEIFSGSNPTRMILEEEGITITDRQEDNVGIYFTYVQELVKHLSGGKTTTDKFERTAAVAKDSTKINKDESEGEVEDPSTDPNTGFPPGTSVTYHNLVTRQVRVPRPALVEQRDPCPAGQDCSINAVQIFFDVVLHIEGEPSRKNQVERLISSEVPYFGSILKNCLTTVAEIEDARPLVRQCQTVYDYEFGPRTP